MHSCAAFGHLLGRRHRLFNPVFLIIFFRFVLRPMYCVLHAKICGAFTAAASLASLALQASSLCTRLRACRHFPPGAIPPSLHKLPQARISQPRPSIFSSRLATEFPSSQVSLQYNTMNGMIRDILKGSKQSLEGDSAGSRGRSGGGGRSRPDPRDDPPMNDSDYIDYFITSSKYRRFFAGHFVGIDALMQIIINLEAKLDTKDDNQQDQPGSASSSNVQSDQGVGKDNPPLSYRASHTPGGPSSQPARRPSKKSKQRQSSRILSGPEPLGLDSEIKKNLASLYRENRALQDTNSALKEELNEMEERHRGKVRQIVDEHSSRLNANQQQYNKWSREKDWQYTEMVKQKTEEIEEMKKTHVDQITAIKGWEQRNRMALESQLDNLELEHRKKILEQVETLHKQEDLRLQELRADKEELREQLKSVQARVENADKELETEKDKLKKRADEELGEVNRAHMLRLEALGKKKDMEMEALVGRHEVAFIEKDKECRGRLESQALELRQELEKRERGFQARLDDLQDKLLLARENAMSWKSYSNQMVEEREAAVKNLEIAETSRQVQLQDAASRHQENLEEQSKRHLEQVATNKTRHDEEIKKLQDAHREEVESLSKKASEVMKETKDRYGRELAALIKQVETEAGRVTAKYDVIIQELKQTHHVTKSQLKVKHDAEIKELMDSMEKERSESQQQIQELEGRVASLREQMEAEAGQFKDVVDSVQTQHSTKMLEQRSYYKNILANLKKQHETAQATREARLKDEAAKNLKDIREQNNRLKADLLTPKRKQQAWTDEMLKIKFQDLKQLIEDMVSPHQLDKGKLHSAAQAIDPIFLESRGPEMNLSHYLVKSRVWEVIYYAFFSLPFGFGAFGAVKGNKPVIDLYVGWRMLLYGRLGTLDRKYIHTPTQRVLPYCYYSQFNT